MKQKIVILGFGVSGKSVCRYFQQRGIEPLVMDRNPDLALSTSIDFQEVECVVVSPGVPLDDPWVLAAKEAKVAITSEIELALRELAQKKVKVIGVTGSNGKTTTTLMIAHLLQHAGKRVRCYGNIGTPLLEVLHEKKMADYLVVELSSFQLDLLPPMKSLDAAVLLNISPDHLDHHKSMHAYSGAKCKIATLLKEEAKLYLSDDVVNRFFSNAKEEIIFFEKVEEKVALISSLGYREGRFLHGDLQNWKAAIAVCSFLNLKDDTLRHALQTFQKPPHRFEFVCSRQGVYYINDSKATTAHAVISALESMQEKVILIAGGLDKGVDFRVWRPFFKQKVEKVFVIGAAADKIAQSVGQSTEVVEAHTLRQAVHLAASCAKAGQTVLLSPGCASFDQFKNYQTRGEHFRELVTSLGEL